MTPSRLQLIAACLLFSSCSEAVIPPPRGVLLISVDSLRADHVTSYGYKSSTRPEIDTMPIVARKLARDGTQFQNATSTTSWTLPSHMAMLTGLPDELHRVREIGFRLSESHQLLSEQFKEAGWRTAGFWSGPNLDPWFGFSRGFDVYVDCSTSTAANEGEVFNVKSGMSAQQVANTKAELKELHDASHVGITGHKTVAAFDEWFAGVKPDERFFAFVHMWDVHYDYTPPPEFDIFDPDYRGSIDGVDVDDQSSVRNPPSARDVEHVLALYDGEIRLTDSNIGRMLGFLEKSGRFDDTLIIFTSDHGEEFLEHGNFGHGNTLFEEVTRIPLILRYPAGIPAGEQRSGLVGLVDIAPTILELCQLPVPSSMWGTSLMAEIRGELEPRLMPLERSFLVPDGGGIKVEEMRGVRAEDFKLIRDMDSSGGKIYFYDLEADPLELEPRLSGELGKGDARVRSARELWNELDRGAESTEAEMGEIPEDLESRLNEAGYMGDDPADAED